MILGYMTGLLFFLPLLVLPFGASYFETPKIICAEVSIELLLLLSIWKMNQKEWKFFLMNPGILIVLLSLYQLLTLGTFYLYGNPFRLQGVYFLWHMIGWFWLSKKFSSLPQHTTFISSFCIVLITILAWYFGTNGSGRIIGSMGEPNALASVIIFYLPFLLFTERGTNLSKRHLTHSVTLILALGVIGITQSRSGIFASLLILGSSWMSTFTIPIKKIFLILSSLLIISLSTPFLFPEQSWEDRGEIWNIAFQAGRHHPVIGSGYGSVERMIHAEAIRRSSPIQYLVVDSSHNIFLDWWIQGGIIGILILGYIMTLSIKNILVFKDTRSLSILVGICTVMLFNPVSVATMLHFWWILGYTQHYERGKSGIGVIPSPRGAWSR